MWGCDKLIEIQVAIVYYKKYIVNSGVSKSFSLLVNLASTIGHVPVERSHYNVDGGWWMGQLPLYSLELC